MFLYDAGIDLHARRIDQMIANAASLKQPVHPPLNRN
jgi:hypothetical protein